MITNFNEQLCIDFDLEIAVFLENLVSWLRYNASKTNPSERNYHDNRYWSYDSYPELAKRFKCWSSKSMRTIIARCVKYDLLIIGNYNKKKYDNTNWYTLTDKGLEYFPRLQEITKASAQSGKGSDQTGRPIPEDLNSLGSNINITTTSSKLKGNQLMQELIDVYRQEFPNNPQPHKTLLSTSLEKVLRTLIKRWPEADPNKQPITPDAFRRYMVGLKELSPKFALGEYETQNGNRKKNSLETFARWNTFVKFLEDQYS